MSQDFSTIDHLVDFGVGIAIARQMIDVMNTAMAGMNTPKVNVPPIDAAKSVSLPPVQMYVCRGDSVAGPLTEDEVSRLAAEHKVGPDTLVWMPGMSGWTKGSNVPLYNKILLLNN